MALMTGYYNSINGDRKYNAETMSNYYKGILTRGVLQNYKDKFVVIANGGMKVKVPTGRAYFSDGKFIENTADIIFTLDNSDVVLDRIDIIVLRSDKNENVRNADIILKKGTPRSKPVAPTLTNDEYIEEMCICEIRVNRLVEEITQSNITNTIPNNEVCGYVTGLIDQVETADLFIQYQKAYEEFGLKSENDFNAWWNGLKDKLNTFSSIRKIEKVHITKSIPENEIPIEIDDFIAELDILNVYINGFKLTNDDFTFNSDTITLNNEIDVLNTVVEIVVYKVTVREVE